MFSIGDTVVVTEEGSKHTGRDPHIVTGVSGEDIKMMKVKHSGLFQDSLQKWSPFTRTVNKNFITLSDISVYQQI